MTTTWLHHCHNMTETWLQQYHNMNTTWLQHSPTWPQHDHNMTTTFHKTTTTYNHNDLIFSYQRSLCLFNLFLAYDTPSYIFGVVFCCCIGVFPVVLVTSICFHRIFVKLNQRMQALQETAPAEFIPEYKTLSIYYF